MTDVSNLGKEIHMLKIRDEVKNGKTVVTLCKCRKTIKQYMEMYGRQLYGTNFIKNYSEQTISYNDGKILFFLESDAHLYKGLVSDFYMIVKK